MVVHDAAQRMRAEGTADDATGAGHGYQDSQ
jgi:hypothetical protein